MKKGVVLSFLFFSAVIFSQTIVSPQFSELKGLEDQQGNTHLFYRIYESYENDPMYWSRNDIYHFDLSNQTDTLFLTARYHQDPTYNFNRWISDLDFWNNNPAEFIYSGGESGGQYWEGSAYVKMFDGFENNFGYFNGSANYVEISPGNDSTLFLGVNTDGGFGILNSADGGRTWDSLSAEYQFLSLNPYSENIYFIENEDRQLFRTTDTGNTFNLVDPEFLVDTRFYYDLDGIHIYRKAGNKLIVSDNIGEQFSWQTVYTNPSTNPFYFSNDNSVIGSVFITDRKNILHSTDFGSTFNLYKTLDRKVVGIYKKPNSDKLYAATKYKMYEITPDTIIVIKKLPSIDDLTWYPLAVGNLWIYENKYYYNYELIDTWYSANWISNITIEGNGKSYFEMKSTNTNADPVYLRIDTLNSLIFGYDENTGEDLLFEDLTVELGDTVCYEYQPYWGCQTVQNIEEVSVWDSLSTRKDFLQNGVGWLWTHSLLKEFGLFQETAGDLFTSYTESNLYSCVINGVVYGDTSVVSVEDENPELPTEFSLSQNYPNPFNPSTKIKFTIPASPLSFGEGQGVRLIVYDILGNEIATLVNEEKPAGEYEIEFNASNLSSGIYYYQLRAGSYIEAKKMVYLK